MRNLKKVLGLVLCLAMMLSIMVVGAGAAFVDQKDIDTKHQEAVDMCVSLNIITGFENGKFMPNDNVTREQMAKMICVLDNGGKEPQLATGNTFTDVPADRWSNKYIEACAARGVVVGTGNNKFSPAGKVTATQAAKMLLVELGYDDEQQQYSGANWATKVNVDATAKGYYEGLEDIDVNAPLSREHAAQMIWNALQQAEIVYTYSANGAMILPEDKTRTINGTEVDWTLIRDKYGVVITEGTLGEFSYNSKDNDWTYTVAVDKVNLSASNYDASRYLRVFDSLDGDGNTHYLYYSYEDANSATDYTDLLGQRVKMVWKYDSTAGKDVVMGIFPKDSVVLFDGVIGDLPDLSNTASDFKFDGTKYKFEGTNKVQDVNVYYFQGGNWYTKDNTKLSTIAGTYTESGVTKDVTQYDAYNFQAVDKDGNGKIDFLMVYPYAVAKVNYANSTDIKLSKVGTQVLVGTADPALFDISTEKMALEDISAYDGIAKDDYVVYVPADYTKDDTATVTKIDLFNGKVTILDNPDVTIDGTNYTLNDSYSKKAEVTAGSTMTDAVAYNGYIFDADLSANYDITDYAVIVALASSERNGLNGDQAKLMFSDGTKKIVDLATPEGSDSFLAVSALKVGCLYTYDTNKDGEYQLKLATDEATGFGYANGINGGTISGEDYHNNSVTNGTPGFTKLSNSDKNKAGYIDGYRIADDAVIFVRYNPKEGTETTYSYKVITGADMKKVTSEGLADFTGLYVVAAKNSSTGVGDVSMAYVQIAKEKVTSNSSEYGFILKVVDAQNEDNGAIKKVTMMTKDGVQDPIDTVKNPSFTVATASAVEYTIDSDGNIDGITNPVTAMNYKITGKASDALWLARSVGGESTRYELADDAAILIIDASESGVNKAVKVGSVDEIVIPDAADPLNAYVIIDTKDTSDINDDEIVLVAWDLDNGTDLTPAT